MRERPLGRLRLPLTLAFLLGVVYAMAHAIAADGGNLPVLLVRWLDAAFLASVGIVVVQAVRFFVLDVVFLRRQGHRAPALLHAVVSLVLFGLLALFVASGVFGRSLTGAFATSAVASVVIGLALQETLGNVFAGLALQIEQPFRIGDVVRMQEIEGRVETFNWRSTIVLTVDDTRITVPNSMVASSPMEVFARDQLNRRRLLIPAPYEVAPQQVIRLVREAIASVPGVSDRLPPQVRIGSFDDSSMGYEVLYWVEDAMRMASIDAQMRERVWYVFARANVEFPYPHQVGIHYNEPPVRAVLPDVREQRLGEVPFLDPLTPEERGQLAARGRTLVFGPGERVLRAGGEGGSMFVVLSGSVEVRVPRPEGGAVRVAELGPSEVIGEMSLLTGEPRSADVWALDEVEVLEVGKGAMGDVLTNNEALAAALSRHISNRLDERSEAFASASAAAAANGGTTAEASLLQRIRHFFDLG
ncbi:MAG TPA: mechanosensitive ion channel family protein [Rhodothermales bacterium]|nr:mechanosensitive ion channel family protein [Rhodothermales bacterium]